MNTMDWKAEAERLQKIINKLHDEAQLGCATTGQLLDEIRARFVMGRVGLNYRTVDGPK